MLMKMVIRCVVFVLAALALYTPDAEGAYTYQKLDALIPELRQYLGRTHLGTLKARQFSDDYSFQPLRERKSNNLRNLMRIGKRSVPSSDEKSGQDTAAESGMSAMGPVYYIPNDLLQAFRPQSVWLRR